MTTYGEKSTRAKAGAVRTFVTMTCPSCGNSRRASEDELSYREVTCDMCYSAMRRGGPARHHAYGKESKSDKSSRRSAPVQRCSSCLDVLLAEERAQGNLCRECRHSSMLCS